LTIAFRVDASAEIGRGHFSRCLVLAKKLRAKGVDVCFLSSILDQSSKNRLHQEGIVYRILDNESKGACLTHSPTGCFGPDNYDWKRDAYNTLQAIKSRRDVSWIVVDSYALDARWHSYIRKEVNRIFVIDDLANRPLCADVIIDPAPTAIKKKYEFLNQRKGFVATGLKYALLKPEFRNSRPLQPSSRNRYRIHACLGGGSSYKSMPQLCHRLLAINSLITVSAVIPTQISGFESDERITISIDPVSVASTMKNCDVAIGSPGTMLWERFCIGLPTACFAISMNQEPILKLLQAEGWILDLGNLRDFKNEGIKRFKTWLEDDTTRAKTRNSLMKAVDGYGAERLCSLLMSYS